MNTPKLYLVGSLRNDNIPKYGASLRENGFDVFDDWFAAGPEADDWWQHYEKLRGRSYEEALDGIAADHVFGFDKYHLDTADCGILVLPAGRSGHLELGYLAGRGVPTGILMDDPDRWDVMVKFATVASTDLDKIIAGIFNALR